MNTLHKICFTILVIIFSTGMKDALNAQSLYTVENSKAVSIKLNGTSTLHNWSMKAQELNGQGYFSFLPGEGNELKSLDSMMFSVQVENLKSDEKKLDKNAYKALKAEQYKDIVFKLISSVVIPLKKHTYLIKALGNLSIAGVTREITLNVSCQVNKGKTILCTGSENLNMTDYHVTPPAFLLGAMKTGDAIVLEFKLLFNNQAQK